MSNLEIKSITEKELRVRLEKITAELDDIRMSDNIGPSSALYAYLGTAGYSVSMALASSGELDDDIPTYQHETEVEQ